MAQLRDIQHSLPMQLLQAREGAMAHFRPMLRNHDLTEQQWRVIRVLAQAGKIDASELAKRALLLAPSLSRILAHLETNSLVVRTLDPDDQRRSKLSLTAAGRKKYRAVGPDSEALYGEIERRFGRKKLAALYTMLSDLNEALAVTAEEGSNCVK